jgi:DNA-binding transcriptional LysR family regulator
LIFEEPLVAVLPAKHPLATKSKIDVKQLKNETFYTFNQGVWSYHIRQLFGHLFQCGFTPRIVHHASQLNSVLRLVESGFGISLLPENIELGYNLKLKFIPLENSWEIVPLIMITRKENSNPALTHLQRHLIK